MNSTLTPGSAPVVFPFLHATGLGSRRRRRVQAGVIPCNVSTATLSGLNGRLSCIGHKSPIPGLKKNAPHISCETNQIVFLTEDPVVVIPKRRTTDTKMACLCLFFVSSWSCCLCDWANIAVHSCHGMKGFLIRIVHVFTSAKCDRRQTFLRYFVLAGRRASSLGPFIAWSNWSSPGQGNEITAHSVEAA